MRKFKFLRKHNPMRRKNSKNLIHFLLEKLKVYKLELKSSKDKEQKNLLVNILRAQESERYHISKALHNSVCQTLYGIRLKLLSIPELKRSKTELNKMNLLIDQAINETRDLAHSLSPSILNDFGFTAGINEMAQRLSTNSLKIRSYLHGAIDELPPDIQLCFFRIIQELVNNCIKHASASRVIIVVAEKKEQLKIMVQDNGKGFESDPLESFKNGIGLKSISDQIFLLNGELSIESTAKGTTIHLTCGKDVKLINYK